MIKIYVYFAAKIIHNGPPKHHVLLRLTETDYLAIITVIPIAEKRKGLVSVIGFNYRKCLNRSLRLSSVQSSQTPASIQGPACISTSALQQADGRQHLSPDNRVFRSIDA